MCRAKKRLPYPNRRDRRMPIGFAAAARRRPAHCYSRDIRIRCISSRKSARRVGGDRAYIDVSARVSTVSST
jgi:hypothetical protein